MPLFALNAVHVSSPSLRYCTPGGPRKADTEDAAIRSLLGEAAIERHRTAPSGVPGVLIVRYEVPVGRGGLGDCDAGLWDVYVRELIPVVPPPTPLSVALRTAADLVGSAGAVTAAELRDLAQEALALELRLKDRKG